MARTRVERRIEEFKSRVIRAAAELFAAQGMEATKLDDIAEAADVAKRTLSNHFATKAEIVDAVAEGAVSHMVSLVDSARTEGESTRERVALFFDSLQSGRASEWFADARPTEIHPEFAVGLFQHRTNAVDSAEREMRLSDAIRGLLDEGGAQQLPAGANADVLTDVVLGSIYSIMLEGSFREGYESDKHLAAVRDFLVGLMPDARAS